MSAAGARRPRRTWRANAAERGEATLVVYLARSGVGSRRRCDELVREGRVTVDGVLVTFPREKLGEQAEVAVDGEVVTPREYRYVLVNKPRGVASTRYDPHAERVLVDLVPDGRLLFPVGRLDLDTTGLIILTNDGVLANRLMHPRYGVSKTYSARVRGHAGKRASAELRAGIELEDGPTAPAEARLEKQSNRSTLVELTIHEGRKHQVRRMLAAVGLPVEELHRRRYGPLSDKNLKIGAWRGLSGDEVEALRRASEEVERSLVGDDPGQPVDLAGPATAPDADLAAAVDEPSGRRALDAAEADEPPARALDAARSRRAGGRRALDAARSRRAAGRRASGIIAVRRTRATGGPVTDDQSTRLIALRGATTVDADSEGDIKARTEELLDPAARAKRPRRRRHRQHPVHGHARPARRLPGRRGALARPLAYAAAVCPGDPGRGRRRALHPRADPLLRAAARPARTTCTSTRRASCASTCRLKRAGEARRSTGPSKGGPLSMMVIMQEGATDEQIAHVVARIEEVGASAHV